MRTASRKLLLPTAVATAIYTAALHAASDDDRIRQLEAMVAQQQQMIEAMQGELRALREERAPLLVEDLSMPEVNQDVARVPDPPLADSAPASSPPLYLDIYGFAMGDAIYDFKRVAPNWEDTLRVSTIPTRGEPFGGDGNFRYGVRQSRLGVRGGYGDDLRFLLEGELFGVGVDAGQTTFRLRHAWASWKRLGLGQYWSNFMDADIFPNTIDYWGPTGMVLWRNQQLRYTVPLGEDEFSVSFEDPTTALSIGKFRDFNLCSLPDSPAGCVAGSSTAEDLFQAYNRVPDITARFRNNGDFGHYQIAAMVRELGFEQLDTGENGREYGWGINASTGLRFLERDMLKLQLAYGDGIGNYFNDAVQDIAPDSDDPALARATAVGVLGISAYYDHYWSRRWSSSIGWSVLDMQKVDGMGDTEFRRGQIAQVNLLHYPREHIMLGGEFIWGQREDVDGATGEDYRVQFSVKVNFDAANFERDFIRR